MSFRWTFFRCLSLLMLVPACSKTVVSVPRMAPAEVNLAGYKRIAVGDVGGTGGSELVDELAQGLVQTNRYEVLDRQHLDQVFKEQDLGASGLISDETAVSIGQMIGSAALIVGNMSAYDYNERVNSEKKTCKEGKKEFPCTHFIRQGDAKASVTLKVVDTTTGKILAAKTLDARVSKRKKEVDKQPQAFNAREDWLANCRRKLVTDFMKVIAPYQMRVSVELLDDGDLPELEQGNNFAKLGKWDDAIAKYREALSRSESMADLSSEAKSKIHYNIGVALGYSGRYDQGVSSLETAYSLKPEDKYLRQVNVIKRFKTDDARLAEQRAGAEEENDY